MQLIRSFLILCLLVASLAWLIVTNQGLRLFLGTARLFVPVTLRYENVYGSMLADSIVLTGVSISKKDQIINVDKITVDWRQANLTASHINGWTQFIPAAIQDNAQLNIDGTATLDHLQAHLAFTKSGEIITTNARGKWMQQPLAAEAIFTHHDAKWQINQIKMAIGPNNLHVQAMQNKLNWLININNPELFVKEAKGRIHAAGALDVDEKFSIDATINADDFAFADNSVHKLRASLVLDDTFNIAMTADQLNIGKKQIKNIAITTSGKKAFLQDTWSSEELLVKFDDYTIRGTIEYDLQHNTCKLTAKDDWYNAKFNLDLKNKKIAGKLNAKTEDLDQVMKWIPELTRLKGKAVAEATISGTITNPKIAAEAHVTDITATFPSIGIKIKPMEIHVKTDQFSKFYISGKGEMRRGPGTFTINGYIEPFKPNMPNSITFNGTGVEFINNELAHLTASSALTFVYDPQALHLGVTGDIEIESGNVNFDPKKSNTVKSKDVVFINEPHKHKNLVRISPNVYLRIVEGVRFTGLGMDATVSGKLDINHRHDAVYATGRVTIKEGTYKLPGQEFHISKGRLLYPPGTLLANPVLDIKLQTTVKDDDLEIQVHGTAQKPVISESGLADNQDRALSQALLTGSGIISKDLLRDKLKLTELGIISKDEYDIEFFHDPGQAKSEFKNKQFVIGRQWGKRIRTQYLHSLDESKQRLRLKYALNDNWEIGLEGSNRGAGIDLSFVIEQD